MSHNKTFLVAFSLLMLMFTASCGQIKKYQIEREFGQKQNILDVQYDQKIEQLQLKCEYYKREAGVTEIGIRDLKSYVEANNCEAEWLTKIAEKVQKYRDLWKWRARQLKAAGISSHE